MAIISIDSEWFMIMTFADTLLLFPAVTRKFYVLHYKESLYPLLKEYSSLLKSDETIFALQF